jgi:hypothetical protein
LHFLHKNSKVAIFKNRSLWRKELNI